MPGKVRGASGSPMGMERLRGTKTALAARGVGERGALPEPGKRF